MSGEPVIVCMEGGCVTDVLRVNDYNVFDWDYFLDNPVEFAQNHGDLDGEYFQIIKDAAPELYNQIEIRVKEQLQEEEEERKLTDPFWMVSAR